MLLSMLFGRVLSVRLKALLIFPLNIGGLEAENYQNRAIFHFTAFIKKVTTSFSFLKALL
jgi:hypothetical protein